MTRAQFDRILVEEKVPRNGEWRRWTNILWAHRPEEQGVGSVAYAAGLRLVIRMRVTYGLNAGEPTEQDYAEVLERDPKLAEALNDEASKGTFLGPEPGGEAA